MSSKPIKRKAAVARVKGAVCGSKIVSPSVCQRKSDIDIIRERLSAVMSDKELYKETLIKSGVYDTNLKLTKAYR